jgi:threonyl-tRNA synthetase
MNSNYALFQTEALELYKDNVYKTEMITNLEDGTITFCDHDTFTDLSWWSYSEYWNNQSHENHECCWSLLAWCDEKQALTRVYGTSFPKQKS